MERYISIKQVMDDVLDHPLLKDVSLERAVNYAVEFIRMVGVPKVFTEKNVGLEIQDFRVKIPCDCLEVIQLLDKRTNKAFRGATNSFHLSHINDPDLTYKIQNSVIITSIKCGKVILAYRAMETDAEGYPVIIDDANFIKALELYIKKERFTMLFDMNKISQQVYNNTLQAYTMAVAKAQSHLTQPTVDEMQSITNMWNTLIPRTTEHDNGFATLGRREYIRRH